MKLRHPFAWWIWAIALSIAIWRINSIALDLIAIGALCALVAQRAPFTPWRNTFFWSLRMGGLVILIRLFIGVVIGVSMPGTTIFSLPQLHLPHWLAGIRVGGPVTTERLLSTFHESLTFTAIFCILGAATSLSHPRRLLKVLPVVIYEFGVTIVIATTVLPQIVASISRIRKAQSLRGVSQHSLLRWRSIALPVLEDALARSLDLAAAMDSRGYGFSKQRSSYRPIRWQAVDALFVVVVIPFLCFGLHSTVIAIALLLLAIAATFLLTHRNQSVAQ
jgi:energy-coupling factor transporter transmembrane protein EcfT